MAPVMNFKNLIEATVIVLMAVNDASSYAWNLDPAHFTRWADYCSYEGPVDEVVVDQPNGRLCSKFCAENNRCTHFYFDREGRACKLFYSDDYSTMTEKYKGPGYACGYRLVTFSEKCGS